MSTRPKTKVIACLSIGALGAAISIAGCQSAPKVVTQENSRRADVVALRENCPVIRQPVSDMRTAMPFIPLAIAVAPVLAQVVVDGSIKLLEQQKANRNFTTTAQGSGELIRIGDGGSLKLVGRCVVIFRGTLGPWDDKQPAQNGLLTKANLEPLGLAAYPDYYYEGWLLPPDEKNDGKKIDIVLETKLIHFAATGAKSAGSGRKAIGTMLVFSKAAIKDRTDKGFEASTATIPLLFKDIRIGSEISGSPELFQDQRTGFSVDAAAAGPINVYAVLNETEEPRFFEELLLKSVTAKKDNLTEGLTKVLTDALKEAEGDPKKKE